MYGQAPIRTVTRPPVSRPYHLRFAPDGARREMTSTVCRVSLRVAFHQLTGPATRTFLAILSHIFIALSNSPSHALGIYLQHDVESVLLSVTPVRPACFLRTSAGLVSLSAMVGVDRSER